MTFPWQTEKMRRKFEKDEDFARRAIFAHQSTMADILREQANRDRLRPTKRPPPPLKKEEVNEKP